MRLFISGDDNAYVYFWKDRDQLDSKCGGVLKGHSSQIYRLAIVKSQGYIYSLGLNDNTLVEWKVDFLMEEEEDVVKMEDIKKKEEMISHMLLRELKFYHFIQETQHLGFKDSLVLFRGSNQKPLNKLLLDYKSLPKFKESEYIFKRPPPLSLQMDFVYGFECFERRQTLFYIHFYDQVLEPKTKKALQIRKLKAAKKGG